MKTTVSAFSLNAVITGGALLIADPAMAQPVQPPTSGTAQPSAVPDAAPRPTSSNPWQTLPRMSSYRCLAEAIGTAADPKTGAPVRASVDPQTGKPICPPVPSTETKPPR